MIGAHSIFQQAIGLLKEIEMSVTQAQPRFRIALRQKPDIHTIRTKPETLAIDPSFRVRLHHDARLSYMRDSHNRKSIAAEGTHLPTRIEKVLLPTSQPQAPVESSSPELLTNIALYDLANAHIATGLGKNEGSAYSNNREKLVQAQIRSLTTILDNSQNASILILALLQLRIMNTESARAEISRQTGHGNYIVADAAKTILANIDI